MDPDEKHGDENYVKHLPEEEQQHLKEIKQKVAEEIHYTCDFAYYYISADAWASLVKELEIHHFDVAERLILRGNSINNEGLLDLCDCLYSNNNRTLSFLDIGETEVKDKGIEGLIDTMKKIRTLVDVRIDGCKGVSMDMKAKLEAACRQNTQHTDAAKRLNNMYSAAKKVEHYAEQGVNAVGAEDHPAYAARKQ